MYQVPAPPLELTHEYDKIRKEVTLRISKDRMDEIMNKDPEVKVSKRDQALEQDLSTYGPEIRQLIAAGETPLGIARKLGVSRTKADRLIGRVGIMTARAHQTSS
jgi:hypothetical protein